MVLFLLLFHDLKLNDKPKLHCRFATVCWNYHQSVHEICS